MAHAVPGDRPIQEGEPIVIDMGAKLEGYSSDMTRTVSIGDPGSDARHLYDVVLQSQQAGRARVAADVTCAEGDQNNRWQPS